eukprot:evm.model.scf_1938.3 EVM.evm.TU.scf_1938.3   scf_1938:15823-21218(-)
MDTQAYAPPGVEDDELGMEDSRGLARGVMGHNHHSYTSPRDTTDDRAGSVRQGLGTSLSAKDALLGLTHPRPHKVWRKRHVKLMVVGDAGLGKTTLIRTLLSIPGHKVQMHDGSETTMGQFRREPDSLCSQISWRDDEDRVEWVYTIQDTPGYGDEINMGKNIHAMVNYVNSQNEKWLALESSKQRPVDLSEVEDPRVDACLFCLPPHRLRHIDVKFMKELGKVVPIIPVVTKADTMNIHEATIYRQEVYRKLQDPSQIGVSGQINLFQFPKETLERAGVDPSAAQFQTLPFLVVASNDVNVELSHKEPPVFWPERQYAWGTCEAFNPDHSDVLQLRLLLLKEGLEEISRDKLERYEYWRRQHLSGFRFGGNLKMMVLVATAYGAFRTGSAAAAGVPLQALFRAGWQWADNLLHPKGRYDRGYGDDFQRSHAPFG